MGSNADKPPTLASLRAGQSYGRAAEGQQSLGFEHSAPAERRIWTVAGLVSSIRRQVENSYADIWVEGEISGCRVAPSGHVYFTLKDGDAQVMAVLFRREAQLLRFRPADGLAVLVRGRVSVYDARGQLQLVAQTIEARGAGSLQLAFEQLKARLMAEGLFEQSRKRPLPAFPRCVGVITSLTGAVIRDVVTVVRRRHRRLNLLVYPAVMQGPTSPGSVAKAIRWFNRNPQAAEVIVIARGGGSPEDLACFNDEALARIIAASEIPVVSAIGHETDFTIADFVADLRAPTPSAAAEMITAAQHRIEERVSLLDRRLRRGVRLQLLEGRQRYARLSAAAVLRTVTHGIERRTQRVDELMLRLDSAVRRNERSYRQRLQVLSERLRRQDPSIVLTMWHRRVDRVWMRLDRAGAGWTRERRAELTAFEARLKALSPLNVLSRGYALVYSSDGRLVRSADEVRAGETIEARLGSGALAAQVISIKPSENGNA